MSTSTFHKFAILWLALWFGVIVPGHKRGLVLLPGGNDTSPAATQTGEPCPLAKYMATTGTCCPSSQPANKSNPDDPGAPVTHCAICYLTGVLDVPPAPDFAPQPLELIQVLAWPTPEAVVSSATVHTHPGRAPPIV